MSGGKGRGKQCLDTSCEDALVARPGATDPLLAAREGATEAQMADALRQGLPHLTDPAPRQDSRAGQQPEGAGTTEKGKQPAAREKRTCTTRQATETQPALLAELQALHHTHREATRLFLMAASQGATDAQIADALRQGLPHLTDPASLQDQSFGKQPQGIGIHAEQGKTDYEQQKRTCTTSQATQTQPLLLAADAPFSAALEAVPAEDWCRTWAAGRTIMLRRTSKRVKEAVDKMRLPAVVRLSRSFWDDARNGTKEAKLEFVLRQLAAMTARCFITTLELPECAMKGHDAERFAGVLAQCAALVDLDLSGNSGFGAGGAERLAGVLGQCRELVHLNLEGNGIGPGGAERLAGVLGQFAALAHLNLRNNQIGPAGAERIAGVLGQCRKLVHLNLCLNDIRAAGAERLSGVLAQCTALSHLDLSYNDIGPGGAERLAGVLAQCRELVHLALCGNEIGAAGAESLAGVLAQCPALAHLNLYYNQIEAAGADRLAGVLGQCTALAHLDLSYNWIGEAGSERLAGVLGQCAALTHLDLYNNHIGNAGAVSLAGVLAQCTALAHLDLHDNGIDAVGKGRLQASWRGEASGLVL